MIDGYSVLGIMFLVHFFADFNLQIGASLDKLKQLRWWKSQVPDVMWRRYRHDYKIGMLCHAMYWSLAVCLPLAIRGGKAYLCAAVVNGIVHYVVDDLKANRLAINLVQDQLAHAVQVTITWAAYMFIR